MNSLTKAIIFGSNGQDGYYLELLLRREGLECISVSRNGNALHGDVGDFSLVERLVKEYSPSYIFHLAAASTVRHQMLFENHHTISTGTLNILEAIHRHSPSCKVFLSGSALQFHNTGQPIDEKTPFEASSPYAVARIHSAYAARYFRDTFGLQVYIGYFFHHDSPLRKEQHISQKIVQAVLRINAGSNEKLELGDRSVKKEFTFAGDTMEAVWILVNQDKVFEAVIGSGIAYSIHDWVRYCFSKFGKNWEEYTVATEGYKSEFDILVSNPERIKSLGWRQKISFEQLADLMLGMDQSVIGKP